MNLIREIFLTICNMTFTAGIVILLVLLARQLLRKSPKIFSYMLWGIVAFRLICPFSFSSRYSLFSLDLLSRHVSSGNQMIWNTTNNLQSPRINDATNTADNTSSGSTPSDTSDVTETARQTSAEKAASQSDDTRLPFQAMQMPDLQQLSVLYRLLFLRLIPKAQEHLYRKFLLFPIS